MDSGLGLLHRLYLMTSTLNQKIHLLSGFDLTPLKESVITPYSFHPRPSYESPHRDKVNI
jgi:hypothetical protein